MKVLFRRINARLQSRWRQSTWRGRALPELIVIGAMKSGTSSVYSYLGQHPQLLAAYREEVHYFDGGLEPERDSYCLGEAWYRGWFPLRRNMAPDQKAFEVTPLYLFNPLVPQRIARMLPDVKLVAVLRDPKERAISHYFHEVRKNRERRPMLEAIQAEEQDLAPIIARQDFKHSTFIHQSYKRRGVYFEQLTRFLQHFSREQLLVINSERLFAEPSRVLKRIFRFVGVDATVSIGDLSPRNVARNRSSVPASVYDYLREYFRKPNEALYELLGEDFGWQNS